MSSHKRPPPSLNPDSDSDSDTSPPLSKRRLQKTPTPPAGDADDDDDDYMNMIIAEPTAPETFTQRKKREAREAEIRGRPKSKAELAALEKEKRETALSKSLLDEATASKGLRMMKMMGFKPGSALGKQSDSGVEARLEPLGVVPKSDRGGIGHGAAQREKIREMAGEEETGRSEMKPEEYRARVAEEREERRKEGLLYAAQKVCEGFDTAREYPEEAAKGVDLVGRERTGLLKGVNVLWRGLVKYREGKERERRMRYDLVQSLGQPRLAGVDRDRELDEVDKVALGIGLPALRKGAYVEGEEEDEEEDEELAEFEGLSFAERLERVAEYLRKEYHYCFWCKHKYENGEMDGCPGSEEDLHG